MNSHSTFDASVASFAAAVAPVTIDAGSVMSSAYRLRPPLPRPPIRIVRQLLPLPPDGLAEVEVGSDRCGIDEVVVREGRVAERGESVGLRRATRAGVQRARHVGEQFLAA